MNINPAFIVSFSDDLMESLGEDAIRQQMLMTESHEDNSPDGYMIKVLSGKDGGATKSPKKERAPKRPLVCIPCKKRFNRRSKLDEHNRVVHNTLVRYSCDNCQKTFSRRDHIARHVKNGHCNKQSHQPAADTETTELSVKNEDNQLLAELSMYISVI